VPWYHTVLGLCLLLVCFCNIYGYMLESLCVFAVPRRRVHYQPTVRCRQVDEEMDSAEKLAHMAQQRLEHPGEPVDELQNPFLALRHVPHAPRPVLCCALLCSAVLCRALLCSALPLYAILCCGLGWIDCVKHELSTEYACF
jgi:hypothetical protein